jgi:hypothetical protein
VTDLKSGDPRENGEVDLLRQLIAEHPERLDLRRRFCQVQLLSQAAVPDAELDLAFPNYPGPDAIYAFLSEPYSRARQTGDFVPLESPTKSLHERFESCPCALHFRVSVLRDTGRSNEAISTLDAHPELVQGYEYLAKLRIEILSSFDEGDSEQHRLERLILVYPQDAALRRRLIHLRLMAEGTAEDDDLGPAFPSFPGDDVIYNFIAEPYQQAEVAGTLSRLDGPTRFLHMHFPDSAAALYFRASVLLRSARGAEAQALIESGSELVERHAYLGTLRDEILARSEPGEGERHTLERYLGAHPDRTDLQRRLCYVRLASGEDLADGDLSVAFTDYPGPDVVHSFLNEPYVNASNTGDFSYLEVVTRFLQERYPTCPAALYFRASVLLRSARGAEAQALIESGSELVERHAYLGTLRDEILARSEPGEGERHTLERYLGAHPDRTDLQRRLCYVRLALGEDLADEDLTVAFTDYPGADVVHSFLNEPYINASNTGDFSHLEVVTRFLQERYPTCPAALYFRTRILFDTLRAQEARSLAERHMSIVEKFDYLASLYASLVWHGGDETRSRVFIKTFFHGYDGDLWRSDGFQQRQKEALARNLPPILFATVPKSGSLFILNTIIQGLDVPYTYLCPLGMHTDMIIDERLRDFSLGGCVSVDHPWANQENLDALHRRGIRRFNFHYREIRQAVLSMLHHRISDEVVNKPRREVLSTRVTFDAEFVETYKTFLMTRVRFLEGWVSCLESDDRFDILVTSFDDLADERQLFQRILAFYEIPEDSFDWTVLGNDKEKRAGHFRKGLKEEWRDILSPELQSDIEDMLARHPVMSRIESAARQRNALWTPSKTESSRRAHR